MKSCSTNSSLSSPEPTHQTAARRWIDSGDEIDEFVEHDFMVAIDRGMFYAARLVINEVRRRLHVSTSGSYEPGLEQRRHHGQAAIAPQRLRKDLPITFERQAVRDNIQAIALGQANDSSRLRYAHHLADQPGPP